MATTYNFTDGSISGVPKPPEHTPIEDRLFVRRHIIDCSLQTLEAGAADVGQVINIPADCYVISAWIKIITAETANGTLDLGWGTNPDEWGDALAVDSTAGTVLGAIQDWVPLYFSAADTIDVTATTDTADVDLDGVKFEVIAVMLKSLDAY